VVCVTLSGDGGWAGVSSRFSVFPLLDPSIS
jgi:hypothetical protein